MSIDSRNVEFQVIIITYWTCWSVIYRKVSANLTSIAEPLCMLLNVLLDRIS